jgi:hypothetical protein
VSVLPPQPPVTTAPPKLLPDPPPTPASMADPMKDKDLDFWSKLAPENVWKSVKKATGNGPNEGIARAAFKEGQELFKQKKFSEAARYPAGRRRLVHAGREPILFRPVFQGSRHLQPHVEKV